MRHMVNEFVCTVTCTLTKRKLAVLARDGEEAITRCERAAENTFKEIIDLAKKRGFIVSIDVDEMENNGEIDPPKEEKRQEW